MAPREGRSCADGLLHLNFCLTGEGNLTWLHMNFLDYNMAFDKVNTVELHGILHNDREPQHILTNMFNTRENSMMSMRINNESVRMETDQPRISTTI